MRYTFSMLKPKPKPKSKAKPKPEAIWRKKFSGALSKVRQERGHHSAYAFFHENGGQKYFGFSYNHYLRIERGVRLPDQLGLKRILDALGSSFGLYFERRPLLLLYVKALLGGDPLFDSVFAKPITTDSIDSGKTSPQDMILRNVAKTKWGEIPLMSRQQLDLITSDKEVYWIFIWLVSTGLKRTVAELAIDLKRPVELLTIALSRLIDQKLIEQTKDGEYFSPHFETDLSNPNTHLTREQTLWFQDQILEKSRSGGRRVHSHAFLVAEDDEMLGALAALLRETVHKANLLRSSIPASKGHLVSVECCLARLMPIPE
ncbi:MAG: hypothetical protein A2X86_08290 [Bdellovibrionales bacterium GWA2_49_15]|nr:MAG: hypothetical protein A2X86_08290 [Bdellovibrionales bacterium GWA2_49_15]HAZ11240.1 hypothetical protein [Bdellovibrionales bacterium]